MLLVGIFSYLFDECLWWISKTTVHTYSEMSVGKVFWLSILRSVKLWILYFHASLIWKTFFWGVFLVLQCHSIYMILKIKFCLSLCSESFPVTHIENYFFFFFLRLREFWGLSDCSSMFFFHHIFHALHLFGCGFFFICGSCFKKRQQPPK